MNPSDLSLEALTSQEITAFHGTLLRRPRLWSPRPALTVSQYAEARRVLPPGTPFPGPWSNARTPYLVEPMDNMSPSSSIQRTVIAKGAQLGFTAAAENVTAFWMDASPAEILFVSATEELLRKWVTKRLEPTIDSCGFRKKIAAQNQVHQRRRTGDRVFTKEYPGGTLDMASAQSAASLRADSKRVLIRDEIDGARAELASGEGLWLDVSYVRTNAWGSRRKVLDFSTPTTFEETAIWPEYLAGDCRKFSVPCPLCGGFQFLVWDGGADGPGIKWRTDGNHVAEVWYQCEHCKGAIHNHDKARMLPLGEWQPTAVSESPVLRSYHLSSLYSPVGMLAWEELVAAFLKAQQTVDGMRSFRNLYLGEPYREEGQRPDTDRVVNLRTGYKAGTIPSDEVLFLTMAVDVQQGSARDQENNPARLEVEVCAHGAGYRSWSIQYYRIAGAINNPYSGAWEELNRMALEGEFRYRRGDGREFSPMVTLIDSGDGTNIDTVYQFAGSWINTYACAGVSLLKKKQDKNTDEVGRQNFDRYRVSRQRHDTPVIQVSTNYYKHLIYRSLDIPFDQAATHQAPGFCGFPQDYPHSYFEMLTAEEKRTDGSFYCPSNRRNEALDCFDEKTEILTEQGWKRFKDLNRTEKVATIKLDGEEIQYQKPTEYIEKKHDGEMIHIKGRRIDIMTTPNHRMVATKKKQEQQPDGTRKWNLDPPMKIVLAKDLSIHHQLLMTGNWKGEHVDKIEIPAWVDKGGKERWPRVSVDAGDWAEFLGWMVSEGSTFRGEAKTQPKSIRSRTQIDQNEGFKADRIRNLLKRLPWRFRETKMGKCLRWVSSSAQLYDAVGVCGRGVRNKKVPGWIKKTSQKNIKRFLDAAVMGDGWSQKTSPEKYFRSYATVSRQLADDIQELFVKNGCASNLKVKKQKMRNFDIVDPSKKIKPRTDLTQYHITELKSRKASLDGGIGGKREFLGKRVNYTGMVYCVSVPNGTLICRRNGRSFIAGNCRVYNLAARDFFVDTKIQEIREAYQKQGATKAQLQEIRSPAVLQAMANAIRGAA